VEAEERDIPKRTNAAQQWGQTKDRQDEVLTQKRRKEPKEQPNKQKRGKKKKKKSTAKQRT